MVTYCYAYLDIGSRLVHKCVHIADETGQNCLLSNILKTVCDCRELSSHRIDSLVLSVSAVRTSHKVYDMSHQTHYRSYHGRVFTDQLTQPTVSKH